MCVCSVRKSAAALLLESKIGYSFDAIVTGATEKGTFVRVSQPPLEGLLAQGALKYRETISQGLESAPEAFVGLLKGKNFGKQLVKLI